MGKKLNLSIEEEHAFIRKEVINYGHIQDDLTKIVRITKPKWNLVHIL